MKFQHAAIPLPLLWSSPFVRWQGSLADVSSLDLAAAVTGDALAERAFDRSAIDRIVLGLTIPQPHSFYGAPWLASRLGLADVSGPLVAQAGATSVACVVAAAAAVEADAEAMPLVVTTVTGFPPLRASRANRMPQLPTRRVAASRFSSCTDVRTSGVTHTVSPRKASRQT